MKIMLASNHALQFLWIFINSATDLVNSVFYCDWKFQNKLNSLINFHYFLKMSKVFPSFHIHRAKFFAIFRNSDPRGGETKFVQCALNFSMRILKFTNFRVRANVRHWMAIQENMHRKFACTKILTEVALRRFRGFRKSRFQLWASV